MNLPSSPSPTPIKTVDEILATHPDVGRDHLIPILQEVQESQGYLSRDSIVAISRHLNLPASKVYGVATFYNQFRFKPLGRFHIMLCRGTACHVKGSAAILERVEKKLRIKVGDTSRDGLFSLEVVACIGACGLAPVVSVNGEFHAGVTEEKMDAILDHCQKLAKETENVAKA